MAKANAALFAETFANIEEYIIGGPLDALVPDGLRNPATKEVPDHSSVTVYGSWCDMIKTTASNMVQIVYGCPDIIVT